MLCLSVAVNKRVTKRGECQTAVQNDIKATCSQTLYLINS